MEQHEEEPAAAAPSPAPAPLLRLALAGEEGVALVGVSRTRVLKHQQEQEGKGHEEKEEEDAELAEAARELALYEDGQEEVTLGQLRAVRVVLRRLATPPAAGQPNADAVFEATVLKGARLTFPRHAQRKAEAQARLKATEAWRQRLVARSQQREYDRMVKNVHWGGQRKPDAETRPFYQASIAFNMLAAMATAGFLGYYVSGVILSEDSHRLMVGTVTAMGMLMVEMVLYIIRTTELERYQPKRQRNEEMGQKGLTIPTGPLDDFQWHLKGPGRGQQRPSATMTVGAATAMTAEKGAERSVSDSAEEEAEAAPLLSEKKDKDV